MNAKYAGAVVAALVVGALAVAQTSSRARLSTAGGASTSLGPSATGTDLTLTPGPLRVGAAGMSTDGGFTYATPAGVPVAIFSAPATATMNVNFGATLIQQWTAGTTYIENSLQLDKASGTVASNTLTGAKTCLGTSGLGCLTYETANASVNSSVAIASPTEFVSFVAAPNALLSVSALGGTIIGPKAFTLTGVSLFVATQALTTAATTVFTLTDGTNTCTATFTCDGSGIASLQGAGPKRVAVVNGAGTGCVYSAEAPLTLSVTTQGCGTAAIVNNINVVGKWQ